ncbi:MAG: helix-turn-helix domain-containing protein, partial [Verrucomicrobiota bacterium]
GDDIIELALHFLSRAAERSGKRVTHLDEGAMEALRRYPWPGNIRELENAIERAVVLVEGDALTVADLPTAVSLGLPPVERGDPAAPQRPGDAGPGRPPTRRRGRPPRETLAAQSFQEPGKDDLLQALARAGGNKAEAARLLGVPRSTFFSRMKRFGLE